MCVGSNIPKLLFWCSCRFESSWCFMFVGSNIINPLFLLVPVPVGAHVSA